ncbi:hypothetical protein ACMU_10125 [Actibacterium mucosum KCTC 23349]|uniref:Uncharacterized protein n=1 Tax=Actibacterium mucosum KCTC 23349 TaxID=1454373 RepID=A0A037ZKD8_9RHOB|nr:hypothetical protein [Actibacterium mucosum]KAJ56104.1 hypothetical protein ACMU_10125 [Actibacterium mucosum KCTC 23349]
MPLEILGPLVVFGILFVAVLLHLLGYSRRVNLRDEAQARAAWVREFPDTKVLQVAMAGNGRAALVMSSAGAGIVWAFGADTVARRLSPKARLHGDHIALRFPDYGTGQLRIPLPPETVAQWRDLLHEGEQ